MHTHITYPPSRSRHHLYASVWCVFVCARVCVCVFGGGLGFVVVNGITPHHQHPPFVTRGIQCPYYWSPLHSASLSHGWASTSVLARGVWHRIRVRSAPDCRAGLCEILPEPDFISFGQYTIQLYPLAVRLNLAWYDETVSWLPGDLLNETVLLISDESFILHQ